MSESDDDISSYRNCCMSDCMKEAVLEPQETSISAYTGPLIPSARFELGLVSAEKIDCADLRNNP